MAALEVTNSDETLQCFQKRLKEVVGEAPRLVLSDGKVLGKKERGAFLTDLLGIDPSELPVPLSASPSLMPEKLQAPPPETLPALRNTSRWRQHCSGFVGYRRRHPGAPQGVDDELEWPKAKLSAMIAPTKLDPSSDLMFKGFGCSDRPSIAPAGRLPALCR